MNFSTRLRAGWSVNVGVNNLFDKGVVYANAASIDAPVQSKSDLVGRYIYANMRYAFK
jgi:iron complex outermembrane receptor protein